MNNIRICLLNNGSKNTVAMVTDTTSVGRVYLLHCTSFVVKHVKALFKCVPMLMLQIIQFWLTLTYPLSLKQKLL